MLSRTSFIGCNSICHVKLLFNFTILGGRQNQPHLIFTMHNELINQFYWSHEIVQGTIPVTCYPVSSFNFCMIHHKAE